MISSTHADSNDLEAMFEKIEGDAAKFARYFESLLMTDKKCSSATQSACMGGNYDDCASEYPEASCPGNEYAIPVCGDGNEGGCGALFDFTASTVRLSPDIDTFESSGNPVDLSVQETVCTTLQADEYMREQTVQNKEFWDDYSVSPPWYHYGADDGVFRIYPGNPKKCPSDYDPRLRPWYVAASSGPKDVVLLLDTSGSMRDYGRMDIMKLAVTRVINTLSVSDYVAVVPFNTDADVLIQPPNLIRATDENKELLIQEVSKLSPSGRTDFYKGFEKSFEILERSSNEELTANCHKAILFLTDGEMNSDYYTADDLFDLVDAKINGYTINNQNRPVIFSYSFGGSADETIPKELACAHDGIWAQIEDDGDLAESMGGFYKYFAYGLGDEVNEDFVAWVSPYEFATGVGLGTTASAPVYDRSVDPPVLAGVVGLDLSFAAMERALGPENTDTQKAVIEKMAERSKAKCPSLELNTCQLQSLRYWTGEMRSKGLCNNTGEDACELNPIMSPTCDNISRLNLYNNRLNEGRSYTERLCCNVGEGRNAGELTYEEIKDQVCAANGGTLPIGIIIGVVGGALVALVALGVYFLKRKGTSGETNNSGVQESSWPTGEAQTTVSPDPLAETPNEHTAYNGFSEANTPYPVAIPVPSAPSPSTQYTRP